METNKAGIILIIGNSACDISQIVRQINPQAFGFLCYTTQGLAKSTDFIKTAGIDLSCCRFEVIQGLAEKREFFRKSTSLIDFLRNHCKAEVAAVCVGTENLEALALAAIVAHQNQAILRVDDPTVHLVIDSGGAMLVDSLSAIVKQFNLFHYRDVLADIENIGPKIKSSKGKVYISFLTKLASAYYDWDCRRYSEACSRLKEVQELLQSTKDDFSHIYDHFTSKFQFNIEFLEKLSGDQTALSSIDAFFNGYRRYDAADNLICILALANSMEFCLRARLVAKGYDPDDFSKLNKSLLQDFGENARKFFIEKKQFQMDTFDLDKSKSYNAIVTPGLSHKPGFMDLLQILEFMGDDFFKEIAGVIDAPENPDYMSIIQLNTLRNRIVHRMGTVTEDELPKAIKLAEYVIEKFLSRMVLDNPKLLPRLKHGNAESLMLKISEYATHVNLNLRDIILGVFS